MEVAFFWQLSQGLLWRGFFAETDAVAIATRCAESRYTMGPAGFEPTTSCSGGKRSIQLSYGPKPTQFRPWERSPQGRHI